MKKIKTKVMGLMLFCTLFFACQDKENPGNAVVLEINAENAIHAKLNEVATDIEVIELDIPKGIELGRLYHIKSRGGYLFLHDRFNNRTISIFKEDGSYVGQLDKTGRGPGEYLGLDHFAINPEEDQLIVYERQRGFYFYSLPDFEFLNFEEERRYFNNIEFAGSRKLLTVTESFKRLNHKNGIGLIDLVTSEYAKLSLRDATTTQIDLSFPNTFTYGPNGNLIYAFPGYITNVFEINLMKANHIFSIDFGKNKIPEDAWLLEDNDEFERAVILSNTPKALWVQHFLFNEESAAFFYPFKNPNYTYLAVCDLSENDCTAYSGILLADGFSTIPPPMGVTGSYFLSVIYPEMSDEVLTHAPDSDYPKWQHMYNLLVQKNRPFLLKYKLI
ncbi:MAG: 6-bladed beta-propeller [bacterium]